MRPPLLGPSRPSLRLALLPFGVRADPLALAVGVTGRRIDVDGDIEHDADEPETVFGLGDRGVAEPAGEDPGEVRQSVLDRSAPRGGLRAEPIRRFAQRPTQRRCDTRIEHHVPHA
jgi:hypothetical protein